MMDELIRESGLADEWIAEGEQRVTRAMARIALEGRFGQLSDDLLAAIKAADEATLLDLVGHIAIETLEQVCARLRLK